eukprot:XP_001197961.2 PREDICTED: integrator complex subunit 12 [Strongylocentrotus purpuratus]
MASIELDPLFMKALALLRSKSKDSTDLLKQMLDDVLGKTTGKLSSKPASPSVPASRTEVPAKKTTVKRPAEKSSFGAALSIGDSLTGSVEVNAITPEMLLADIIVDDEAPSVLAGCQLHQIVDLINPLLVRFTLPSTMDDRRD